MRTIQAMIHQENMMSCGQRDTHRTDANREQEGGAVRVGIEDLKGMAAVTLTHTAI